MKCDDFELRLYDEDCREALKERDLVPPDIADHLALCQGCRQQWAETATFAEILHQSLVTPLSPAVRHTLHGIPSRHQERSPLVDIHLFSSSLATGSLAAALAGGALSAPPAWQAAVFALAGAWSYALAWTARSGLGAQLLHTVMPRRIA